MIVVDAINEAYIRNGLRDINRSLEQKWFVNLIEQTEFEKDRANIEDLPNIKTYSGDYGLLVRINNEAVSLEYAGQIKIVSAMAMTPYILYIYSD